MDKELLEILDAFNPRESGSQIRMECPFREKHLDGSGMYSMFLSPDINAYHCFSCKSKGKLTSLLTSKFRVPLSKAYSFVDVDAYISGRKKTDTKRKLVEDAYYKLQAPTMYCNKKRSYPEYIYKKYRLGESKNEVIIPFIEDGIVIGYVKRNKKNPTKYSLDFKRGSYLYNHDSKVKSAIVVEGQADVWRIDEWKLHAVGLGGTEYSERILDLLKTYDELYLALDNDLAGIRCANKLYNDLRKHTKIYFIEYEGDDPDTSNRKSFYNGYRNPKSYFDFKMAFGELLDLK